MRIVIDLQTCQYTNAHNRDAGCHSLELAKAMVRADSSHEFWILTTVRLQGDTDVISDAFRDMLLPERIVTFDTPMLVAESAAHNHWRTQATEKIRDFVIAQIEPDILYIDGLFEGFIEEIVTSVRSSYTPYPIVVTLHDRDFLAQCEDSLRGRSRHQWYEQKLASLRNPSALLTLSKRTRQRAISHLSFPQERIFDISAGISQRSNILPTPDNEVEGAYSKRGSQKSLFLWEALAEQAIKALESTHKWYLSQQKNQTQAAHSKEKLAFVSPLPPLQSGISDYSVDLIPKLTEFYDVVVITDQARVEGDIDKQNVVIKDVNWFRENAKEFARIVYQFGNSPFHQHMFDLLQRHPGVVVLHDFYLGNILYWMISHELLADDFSKILYESHGYSSLAYLQEKGGEASALTYPCSKAILDNAVGVIVHSNHARQLGQRYFGLEISRRWKVVPQPYAVPAKTNRHEARIALGFGEGDFIVCSFGMLGPTKLNHRLLRAWLASTLAEDAHCYLIFVGKNHEGNYGENLIEEIKQSGCQARIKITGFLDAQHYRHYLAVADAVVQLRTLSRGETSRAILEALSYATPLIANGHGSVTDYPEDIFIGIPDDFSDGELTDVIMKCRHEEDFCHRIGQLGKQYVLEHHSPDHAASAYYAAVEELFTSGSYAHYRALLKGISGIETENQPQESDLIAIAEAIAENDHTPSICQLLIDVSEFIQAAADTSVHTQNTMSRTISQMLQSSPIRYRIETVYFDGKHYRYARNFTAALLNIRLFGCSDDIIDTSSEDFFLGIDSSIMTIPSPRCQRLSHFYRKGVKIYFGIQSDLWSQGLKMWPHEVQRLSESWFVFLVSALALP